jgi:hypothetical protein
VSRIHGLKTFVAAVMAVVLGAAGPSRTPWAAEPVAGAGSATEVRADVVIYGGSAAGVIAAVQAARMGKTVALVNPYGFLGGMSASGLNSADVGNPAAVSGLARDFFARMGRVYGKDFAEAFEPHVAEAAFNDLVGQAGVVVCAAEPLELDGGVVLAGGRIVSIRTERGRTVSGTMFIDASYEGDLMAKAGVTYVVGREGNARYDETLNGVLLVPPRERSRISALGDDDHFVRDVDPYVRPGDPASGLLPWIAPVVKENGSADGLSQAYNYRLILSDDPANQIPFEKPAGYRELDHELLLRNFEAGDHRLPGRLSPIPNHKIDWNTFGAVGTDFAGANTGYAEADHGARREIDRRHEDYIRGHFWTLAHHPRVPEGIRRQIRRWGYAKDEFRRFGGFPPMLYLREGRRMVGDYVMTEHDCRHHRQAPDPVTLASYPMDSHVVQYVVDDRGFVQREGVFFVGVAAPYGVSYRAIVPRAGECPNLLVPVCISASHAAYGSIRMEPVFMGLAQAAATAACIAIDRRTTVQNVRYADLRDRLRADQMRLGGSPE